MTIRLSVLLTLCSISSGIAARPDRLEEAIEQSNVPLVDFLSQEFVHGPDAPSDKKTGIYDLTLMADEAVTFLKASCSVINDERDCAMALGGAALFSLGTYWTAAGLDRVYSRYRGGISPGRKKIGITALKLSFIALSGYVAYSGLTCSFQNDRIKRARAVRRILEDRLKALSQ